MTMGFYELLIILGIVLLLFGGRKLPEVARGMGKALREFRRAARDVDEIEGEVKSKEEIPEKTPAQEEEKKEEKAE